MDPFDSNHVEVVTAEKQQRQAEARRRMHAARRRFWLWWPLAIAGAGLLVSQVTSDLPVPALVIVGILMCLPVIVDC